MYNSILKKIERIVSDNANMRCKDNLTSIIYNDLFDGAAIRGTFQQ
jgi:hypothetical protein